MNYYVIGPDGSKYGPADIPTLKQWVGEGRVSADTQLEAFETGQRVSASQVPELFGSAPADTPPQPSPYANAPAGPTTGPYATSNAPGPSTGPYANYPRGVAAAYGPELPAELRGKFNWGAFFLSWIWGLNHKAYLTLISLAVGAVSFGIRRAGVGAAFNIVPLGLSIWYGIKGYEWAWQSGRFSTPEECRRVQTTWGWWGLGLTVVCCGGIIALAVLGVGLAAMGAGAMGR